MNEADSKIKQQIISKITSSTNILITVSKNPTVDELSAALGLTTLLNKVGKHATAIFSGVLPPAINFLEPDKVFENTADSLRDFIIALDKEKADHLRYKVEGDLVKIFITPYRTTITGDDLDFSQGDYNIELVLALGVVDQAHLDMALAAHDGQILQDVTIATFSVGAQASQLGSMDWRDIGASSLSEMIVSISGALNENKPILDKQISTALLTGIVAATDRFSNDLTSPRVMTAAAQLMAAGADQKLIATKLQESHEINNLVGTSIEQEATEVTEPILEAEPITVDEDSNIQSSTLPVGSLVVDHQQDSTSKAEQELDNIVANSSTITNNELINSLDTKTSENIAEASTLEPEPVINDLNPPQIISDIAPEPAINSSLTQETDIPLAQATKNMQSTVDNQPILTHSYLGGSEPDNVAPINSSELIENDKHVDIFAESPADTMSKEVSSDANISAPQVVVQPPIPDLPLPPELPDFSTLPPATTKPYFDTPAVAPQPEVSTTAPTQVNNDPAQFKIPGQ